MIYAFFDINIYNEREDCEFDLIGEDYRELIETCCKHCEYFSLIYEYSVYMKQTDPIWSLLKPFSVKVDPAEFELYCKYRSPLQAKKVFYRICPETIEILCTHVNSLWSWIYNSEFRNPEDLTFYRDDASIFFESVTHDGLCAFHTDENEDISHIVSHNNWIEYSKLPHYYQKHWIIKPI